MQRGHGGDRRHALVLQPRQEAAGSAQVGPARVGVSDLPDEELQEAVGCAVAGCGDQGRSVRGDGQRSELDHYLCPIVRLFRWNA